MSHVSYHIEFPVSCPGIFFGTFEKKIMPSKMEVALPEVISKTGYFQTEDILKYIIPKVSEMSLLLKVYLLAANGASWHSNSTPTIARQNLGCNSAALQQLQERT